MGSGQNEVQARRTSESAHELRWSHTDGDVNPAAEADDADLHYMYPAALSQAGMVDRDEPLDSL
ncbi:hypothetical protein GCM10010842_33270 [Deinococcus daejeonensis]|uniref:Uncharacterized protein n=1 Tax=Deinococcus daejeonensis TaxID=1007098 RepID=A0ABQ2JD24_9DEIO|nr:hypothetical protein GCM10010842_33270 [Deinococcus daejeonensis]